MAISINFYPLENNIFHSHTRADRLALAGTSHEKITGGMDSGRSDPEGLCTGFAAGVVPEVGPDVGGMVGGK